MATHIASPHNSRAKAPSASQEDIGSVLERFHNWAGRQAKPVRELSYEEAIARSHRRFYDEEEPLGPQPVTAAAAPVPAPPPPIPFPVVKEPPASEPSPKPARPASVKSAGTAKPASPADPSQNEKATTARPAETKAASAKPAKKAAARKPAAQEPTPRKAQRKSVKAHTARTAKATPATTSKKTNVKPPPKISAPAPTMEAAGATAASAYAAAQQVAEAPEANPLPQATFAQVLAAQIPTPATDPFAIPATKASEAAAARPVPASAKVFAVAPLPDDAPAVHLTVRLASDERESLRERARDLGITPSAYVRQCALEVDSLRDELDHARLAQAQAAAELALAREEAIAAKSNAALCLSTRTPRRRVQESDWFQRLRNFVFPRKAKGQAFATHA